MRISSVLQIQRGITALIGGGGKTTLMYVLAEELAENGSVIICTSTKIQGTGGYPLLEQRSEEELRNALMRCRIICTGTPDREGKLSAPGVSFERLGTAADYVLVEADGSRGLPLKAHLAHEPVIPRGTDQTILVIGADCFGRPVGEVCHRPERFAEISGLAIDMPVTPEAAARSILAEGFGDRIFVNKVESAEDEVSAGILAGLLDRPVIAGSLFFRRYICLS